MRAFKKIFNRTGLVIFIVLIELLLMATILQMVGYFLQDLKYALLIWQVLSVIVEVVMLLIIINKDEAPDFKIPWIVIMILFPILGAALYLIFANHGLKKEHREMVEYGESQIRMYMDKNTTTLNPALIESNYGDSFRYLANVTDMEASSSDKTTFFPEGKYFFSDLLESLKKAKHFIFIEMFIIAEGLFYSSVVRILKDKVKEGVEVKIIYDDLGSLGTINSKNIKDLLNSGIEIVPFAKITPIVSGVYNNRDHRKIIIVDHYAAYTGGMNIADEYINVNSPYGFWKDTMLKIEGKSIKNLICLFLSNYMIAGKKKIDFKPYLQGDYKSYENGGFVFPFGDAPGSYDDNHLVGEQVYISLISSAKKCISISTPYFIPTHALLEAIKSAGLRGVNVKLFFPRIPDKRIIHTIGRSYFKTLLTAGIHIYFYEPGFNHEKCVLIDDVLCAVGTINFDYRSLVHHFECGAVLYKAQCINDIRKDFDEMEKASSLVSKDYRMNGFTLLHCALLRVFTPLL